MKNWSKLLALALAAIMLAGALSACGGSAPDTTTAGPAGSTTTGGGAATTKAADTRPASAEPQILRYGLNGFDGAFMPVLYSVTADYSFCNLFFEPLAVNNTAGEYVPCLATWEMANDNLTYIFTLKEGIAFSDGTPLTTEDVAFTYRMIAHPEYDGTRSGAVSDLVGYQDVRDGKTTDFPGIEIIDARTIAFHYAAGGASPANLRNYTYGIMSKAYYEADTWGQFVTKLSQPFEGAGSGPYILKEFKPKELVHCVKNENYWDKANREVFFDEIMGIEVPADSTVAALHTGIIDFAGINATMENAAALEAIPGVRRYDYVSNSYTHMTFNCRNGIFDDKRVRHAFMYALDRESFIKIEYGDLAQMGMTPIPPVSWAYPDVSSLNPYSYNPDKANALLDEAGWIMGNDGFRYKDGRKLSVDWWVYQEATWPGTLSGMAADTWKQAGIELNIVLMDFATVSSRTRDKSKEPREFDIYTMGYGPGVEPDPKGTVFDNDTYANGGYDCSGYYSEQGQALIQAGRASFDPAERAKIYKEWGALMNEEMFTAIIAYRNTLWGISERIEGFGANSMTDWTLHVFDMRFAD